MLPSMDFEVALTRGAFEDSLQRTRIGLAVVKEDDFRWLGTLSTPGVHVVALTELSVRSAGALLELSPAYDVVWWEEAPARLRPLLRRLQARDPSSLIRDCLSVRVEGSPVLTRVLALLCDRARSAPISSVVHLSEALSVSPSTLRYYWSRRLESVPLKGLLSWLLLIRAAEKRGSLGWSRVAREFGIHRRTLERTAERLTGRTLSELAGPGEVVGLFQAWVAERLDQAS